TYDLNLYVLFSNLFFFFQAEDGIRDRNVTGVQTCALPISINDICAPQQLAHLFKYDTIHGTFDGDVSADDKALYINGKQINVYRSEERRVGKEYRCRGETEQ